MKAVSQFSKRILLAFLQGMERSTPLQRALAGIAVALFFAAALYLRIAFSHEAVFGGDTIRYTGVDAYWHIRIIDNLAHNFPHLGRIDPYLLHPGGWLTSYSFPFYDYLIAGVIWVIGLGSPTQHTVDTVVPYFPPILGALTIIPVYFIGKTLFSRWAGVFAAGLVAILPGEFLGRSLMGFVDHHVAETLFSTTAVMFLVLALKNVKKERTTWSQLRHPNSIGLTKPAIYGLLGGIFLGLYLASWMGALLLVFIMAALFVVQFCIEHMRKAPTDYLCLVGVATFVPALVVFLMFSPHRDTTIVLVIAVLLPMVLFAASRWMSNKGLKSLYYPMGVGGLGLIAFGVLYAAVPSLVSRMIENLDIFKWNAGTAVDEMKPVLWSAQELGYSLSPLGNPLWQVYGFSIIFGSIAFCMLGYAVIKRGESGKVLLIIWTLVILLATLGQRRFNYYLVVNVALLTGYLSWEILRLVGVRALATDHDADSRYRKKSQGSKRKRDHQRGSYRLRPSHAYVALAAVAIFALFTIVPYMRQDLEGTGTSRWVSTVDLAKASARRTRDQPGFAPSEAWCESLTWLREYTPEPFGDADFYYARYDTPLDYSEYPDAYGVMAWWDYGYWIVRIGHRPPCQNPAGAIPAVAEFFLAQNEADGQKVLDARGASYVILDEQFVLGKFHGAVAATGGNVVDGVPVDYYDYFAVPVTNQQGNKSLQWRQYFFPEFYQSMSARLYCFEGKAVTPAAGACQVISWSLETIEGEQYKVASAEPQGFDTYEAAVAWIASQPSGKYSYNIVNGSPFVSPVPLEELKGFALRFDSTAKQRSMPQVRIFEYLK